jgi:hypothetical protein
LNKAVWSRWPDGKAITKNFCLVLPEPIALSGGHYKRLRNGFFTKLGAWRLPLKRESRLRSPAVYGEQDCATAVPELLAAINPLGL